MASTYSSDLSLELITTGEKAGQWGTITNTNLQILQQAASGYVTVPMTSGTDVTLSLADGSDTANGKNLFLELTGTMTASISLIIPSATTGGTATRTYIIKDSTARTNTHLTLSIKTAASAAPIPVPEGANIIVRSDGTNTVLAFCKPGMKTIDSALQEKYFQQLAEGGSLLIHCKQYSHNTTYLTPAGTGYFAVQITKPVSRLSTFIASMAPDLTPDQIADGIQYCNTFIAYPGNIEKSRRNCNWEA